MKRLLIILMLAAAFVAEAKRFKEEVTTPLGLEIRSVRVHDSIDAERDCHPLRGNHFTHGNITFRFEVNNPTSVEQPLAVGFPIGTSYFLILGRDDETWCSVSRLVPPGKSDFDFSVPYLGEMKLFDHPGNWTFTDASGKTVTGKEVAFDFRPLLFKQQGDLKNARFRFAVSRNFDSSEKLDKRFSEMFEGKRKRDSPDLHFSVLNFSRLRDWRDLACYDAVILANQDYAQLDENFRECVKDYQAAGGVFKVIDSEASIDVANFYNDLWEASKALCGYGETVFKSDQEAVDYSTSLRRATPFGGIVLVLLVFVIVSGPVVIFILAKRGKRIHLLWVFPSVAVVFSLAVALVIVAVNGVTTRVSVFTCEEPRPELGRKLVITDTVYVSPLTQTVPITCSPTALVTVDAGSKRAKGGAIVATPDGVAFVGNWTPSLWPVRVRELEVVRTAKEVAE